MLGAGAGQHPYCRIFTSPAQFNGKKDQNSSFSLLRVHNNMTPDHDQHTLAQALARLRAQGLGAPAARALGRQAPELAQGLAADLASDVPAFSASGNPQVLPAMAEHVQAHLACWLRMLDDGDVADFAFVRTYAQRCAEQRFPLEAVLQAYSRLTLRLAAEAGAPADKGQVNGAAGAHDKHSDQDPRRQPQPQPQTQPQTQTQTQTQALLVFAHAYASAAGIAVAAAYVAFTRLQAEAEGDRRTELLGLLLGGVDESDARAARLLKRAGYGEQRLSFCVALVQATDPLEMDHPARAQRIVDAVGAAMAPLAVRVLVGVRNNLVTAVFSDLRRISGWTAQQAALAERLRPPLLSLGPAVLVGLSSDQPSTAFIPRALQEATVALDMAHVGERVVSFPTLPVRRLLIHRGAGYVQPSLPAWLPALQAADAKAGGALLATLRALADADINVQRAARGLGLHANSVYARLQRVADLTSLNPQRFHDLGQLLLVADCARV